MKPERMDGGYAPATDLKKTLGVEDQRGERMEGYDIFTITTIVGNRCIGIRGISLIEKRPLLHNYTLPWACPISSP